MESKPPEITSNYDWNYPRKFGQDYDSELIHTSFSEHENVIWEQSGNLPVQFGMI